MWRLCVGMRDWRLPFPGSCRCLWRAAGQVRDRAQPRPRSGAGGVLELTSREPDDVAAGNGSRLGGCGYSVVSGRPMFRVHPVRGSAAGCIHPFACPRPGPGGMGRVRVRERSGGANQIGALPPGAEGRIAGGLAPGSGQNAWRPRACAHTGMAVHAARAVRAAAGGVRQRICPSRIP